MKLEKLFCSDVTEKLGPQLLAKNLMPNVQLWQSYSIFLILRKEGKPEEKIFIDCSQKQIISRVCKIFKSPAYTKTKKKIKISKSHNYLRYFGYYMKIPTNY